MSSPDQLVHEISQDLEGIGPVRTYCVEVEDLAGPHAPVPDPSSLRRVGEIVGMLAGSCGTSSARDGPSYRSGSLIPPLHWHAPSRLSQRRCAPVADQRPP